MQYFCIDFFKFQDNFDSILELLRQSDENINIESASLQSPASFDAISSSPPNRQRSGSLMGNKERTQSVSFQALIEDVEPIYIINIAIKSDGADDSLLSKRFQQFCQSRKSDLEKQSVRRVSFIVCERYRFPKYFTYRFALLLYIIRIIYPN